MHNGITLAIEVFGIWFGGDEGEGKGHWSSCLVAHHWFGVSYLVISLLSFVTVWYLGNELLWEVQAGSQIYSLILYIIINIDIIIIVSSLVSFSKHLIKLQGCLTLLPRNIVQATK